MHQTHDAFTRLRELLAAAHFTEEALEARFRSNERVLDQLDALTELFLRGEAVPLPQMSALFTPADVQLLTSLELIHTVNGKVEALVSLYPVGPLWVVSDRLWPDGSVAPDVVFSAISPNTQEFLSGIPMRPCRSFLELCGGTGAAALLAARSGAERASIYDICPRAVQFAQRNCLLNGAYNVESLQGDMWEPAAGGQFDFIVAHPPYVPAIRPAYVFRDGGALGDDLLRRVIEGLPAHLAPGGRFYCLSLIPERDGQPVESHVRRWLGDAAGEFDLFLLIRDRVDARVILFENWSPAHNQPGDVELWKRLLAASGVTHYLYAEIIIERRTTPRPVATARRYRSALSDAAAVEWMIQTERAAAQPEWFRDLAATRLTVRDGVAVSTSTQHEQAEWSERLATLHTHYPFRVEAAAPSWIRPFLQTCNGDRTVRDQFLHLQSAGVLSERASEVDFFKLITRLIAGGFVQSKTSTSGEQPCQRNISALGDPFTENSPAISTGRTTNAK